MSFNPDIAARFGFDALSYYFIPHWTYNYAARKVAESNLKQAITKQCGPEGATNEAELRKELAKSYSQPLFKRDITFYSRLPLIGGKTLPLIFPSAIPLLGGKTLPLLITDPVLLFYLGQASDDTLYKSLLFTGAGSVAAMGRGGLFLSNTPWIQTLSPVQGGKYVTGLNDVTKNIQCKNGNQPPKGGNPLEDSSVTQMSPASDPADSTADNMMSSASMAGIPITDLSSQLSQVYGSSSLPVKPSAVFRPGAAGLPGAKPMLPVVPLVTPAPLTLPVIRPVPIARPVFVPVAP